MSRIVFNDRTSKSVPKRRIGKQETSDSPHAQQRGNKDYDYQSPDHLVNSQGHSFRGASDPAKRQKSGIITQQ